MVENSSPEAFRYAAFISYSHADKRDAQWLHRAIERYRVPRRLRLSHSAHRLKPVFLDREELSTSPDLAESVRAALHQSSALIVVCSPTAAQSRWVNEEIRIFKALGRADRIFCVLVRGEPATAERGLPPELECFPPSLRYDTSHAGDDVASPEPLAADLRPGRKARRDVQLRLVAGLLEVPLDELRRREQSRRQKRMALVAAASLMASVVFAGLAVSAWLARNEAERQRALAQQKSLTAERTAQFMVSLFQVSDPSEARGNSITAREILDRGAQQIDDSLKGEPLVRAELSVTLGKVYTGLGLFGQASQILGKAHALPDQAAPASIDEELALADLAFLRGEYEDAESMLASAEAVRVKAGIQDTELRKRILLGQGEVAAQLERTDSSLAFFKQALNLMGSAETDSSDRVRAYEGIALANYYGGDLDAAERQYQQALTAREALSGETHPKVSDSLNQLGSIAYLQGDSRKAEGYFQRVLDVDRRILGPNHPALAATMLNLGRLRLERREYSAAADILQQAVRLIEAQNSDTQPDLVYGYSNLALARIGRGEFAAAGPLLDKALKAAIANDSPLQGPIQVYQGVLACRTGKIRAGLATLELARPVVIARYPEEPWRIAQLNTVQADCLTGLNRGAEAERLMDANLPVLLKRWPVTTAPGAEGVARALRVYTASGNSAKLALYGDPAQQPAE